jgi:hypothetical protein
MNKGVLSFVICLGLLLAFGIDVRGIIGAVALFLIVAAALTSVLTRKISRHFLLLVAITIVGPIFVCCITKALFAEFPNFLDPTGNGILPVLIAGGLMTASFLYVRARLLAGRQHNQRDLHTNERQPLPPAPQENEEEH